MGKLAKMPYFYRVVEMKQPHTRTEPKEKALRGKRIAIPARSPYENGSVC